MRLFFASLTALLLVGCAGSPSVTKNQCFASDWQTIGHRDGANGYPSTQLLAHQDACLRHGLTPDREPYLVGWREGLREFCQVENGFQVGERGGSHHNICPNDLAAAFAESYRDGRDLYLARTAVDDIELAIANATNRIGYLKTSIVSNTARQLEPQLTPQERVDLVALVVGMSEEKGQLERDLPRMRRDRDESIRHLDGVRKSLAGAY